MKPIEIEFRGKNRTFKEISELSGIPQTVIRSRYFYGKEEEELVRPVRVKITKQPIPISGDVKTLPEWSEETGIPLYVLTNRANLGKTGKELVRPYTPYMTDDKLFTIQGVERPLLVHARHAGLPISVLKKRLRANIPNDELLLPVEKNKKG